MVFKNPDFRRKDENGKFSSTPKIPKISHDKPGSKGYRGKKRSKKNPNLPSLKSNKMSVSGNSGLAKSKKLNLNNPKEKELMIKRYRYLLRSPNTPKDKLNNFLTLVVRGLHYSTNCLKPPSKKFINSRKLKLRDRPRGNRSDHLTLSKARRKPCISIWMRPLFSSAKTATRQHSRFR